jgi:hypothetical protein
MRIRLKSTIVLLLVAGIFAAALVFLFVSYDSQMRKQNTLNAQLVQVKTLLAQQTTDELIASKTALQKRPPEISGEIEEIKKRLTQSLDDVMVGNKLFELSVKSKVKIMFLHISKPAIRKMDALDYLALTVDVTVEGEPVDIQTFIFKVTEAFPTCIVDSAVIEIPEVTEEAPPEKPTGKIHLFIHTYERESDEK